MDNKKNIVLINGGAGGIGQACAKLFKNQPLILTDYSEEQVDEVVKNFKADGFDVSGIACDITSKTDIEKLVSFARNQGSLKALIHTAGVSGTVKDLRKVFTIDLVATDLLVDAFYEIVEKDSVAVLLSSMMAHTVAPNEVYDDALANPQNADSFDIVSKFVNGSSDTMYNFAKRGVQLLTHKNANKWGQKGARLVTVSPGVIETPMAMKAAEEHPERMEMIKKATPLQRNGQADDVANVVHFLASDAANFINSTDILVDGGVIHNIKKMQS